MWRKEESGSKRRRTEQGRAEWIPPKPTTNRGYVKLYIDHGQQPYLGADDILLGDQVEM
jgi:hypothetical protein